MTTKSLIKQCYQNNLYFFVPYFLFLFLGSFVLLFTKKGEDIIFINQYNNSLLDIFFKYITYLGDGIFLAILLIPMLIIRIKYFIFLFFSFITSGGITQLLKHIYEIPRPTAFMANSCILHYVPGVKVYMAHSFPSGHTATAFAMFFMLSIISKSNYSKLFFFLSALIVGFSRVYLLQHFFIDVYFGSIVGTLFALINYVLFTRYWEYKNNDWHNLGIVTNFRNRRLKYNKEGLSK